jgi:hypothetical protein
MTVLLLAVNSAWTHTNPALYYLREMIRELPHQVKMEELTLKTHIFEALEIIYQHQPDIICLSVYIWNRSYLQRLIPEIRKLFPTARFVLGGPEAGNAHLNELLNAEDTVITGSGESAFYELAQAGFVHGSPAPEESCLPLAQIPFPYRPEDRLLLQNRLIYYETTRGCPYKCIYCLSSSDNRLEKRFQAEDLEEQKRLCAELDALVALQPRTIKFIDRSFNVFPILAHTIWQYIIDLEQDREFHFEIYPDLLTDADIALLAKVPKGRIRFEIGVQSTNNAVMSLVNRKSDWNKIRPVLLELRKRTEIRLHTDLICGLPGENADSIIHSINEIAYTRPHEIQLGMLKILPNTPMLPIAQERGYMFMADPPYQVLATDTLSFEDICHFEHLAHCINLYWNKGDFGCVFEALMRSHSPCEIFCKLMQYHHQRSFAYHSMEQKKRFALLRDMILECYYSSEIVEAYQEDWRRSGFRGEVDLK